MGELIQNQSDATDGSSFNDLTGREIGRYHIQKRLGRGGLTTVYQAYDMVDDFPVALKILLHSADEKVYNRFRYEAQTAAKLQHAHIVRTLRVGMAASSDTAYIAMELVEGEDLAALLASRRRLAADESCLLLAPIAGALAYAHQHGIIHRDVKPSNILLRTVVAGTPNSVILESLDYPLVPLLSDFGIARALDVPELTHSGRTVGTPAFMAPEQCLGRRNIDHRADLYALGAVFYRCITGRQPFIGSTVQILHAHVYEPITIEEELLRQLSQTHIQLLQRSLAKDPGERYQSAEEMAADFRLGAHPSDLQMTAEQHEQNTTLTLTLLPIEKVAPLAGPSTILVPSSTDLTAPAVTSAPPASTAPDVYYDPVLDRRLRKASGIVLFVLLLLITLILAFSLLKIEARDFWRSLSGFWQPWQSPVMALSVNDTSLSPGVASGNGKIRSAPGIIVWQTPTTGAAPAVTASPFPTATPDATPFAMAAAPELPAMLPVVNLLVDTVMPLPVGVTTTAPITTPLLTITHVLTETLALDACDYLPDAQVQPYLAQLDGSLQHGFRCAAGKAVQGDGEFLEFQDGYMLYLYELDKMFVVSHRDQQWDDVNLAWLDGDTIPPPSEITFPEDGIFTPKQMFGKIWQNKEIRALLGAALMPNAARFPVLAQKFPGGWIVLDQERPADVFFFLRDQRRL